MPDDDVGFTNDDLWAAIRGLGMSRMNEDQLDQLMLEHQHNVAYASRVIYEAARQMRVIYRQRRSRRV